VITLGLTLVCIFACVVGGLCLHASLSIFYQCSWVTLAILWLFFHLHILVPTCTVPVIFAMYQKRGFTARLRDVFLKELDTLRATLIKTSAWRPGGAAGGTVGRRLGGGHGLGPVLSARPPKGMDALLFDYVIDLTVTEYVLGGFVPFHQVGPDPNRPPNQANPVHLHQHLHNHHQRRIQQRKQLRAEGITEPVGVPFQGRDEDFTRVFQRTFLGVMVVEQQWKGHLGAPIAAQPFVSQRRRKNRRRSSSGHSK